METTPTDLEVVLSTIEDLPTADEVINAMDDLGTDGKAQSYARLIQNIYSKFLPKRIVRLFGDLFSDLYEKVSNELDDYADMSELLPQEDFEEDMSASFPQEDSEDDDTDEDMPALVEQNEPTNEQKENLLKVLSKVLDMYPEPNEDFTPGQIEKLTALYKLTGNKKLIDSWEGVVNTIQMTKFCPAHVLHYGELVHLDHPSIRCTCVEAV